MTVPLSYAVKTLPRDEKFALLVFYLSSVNAYASLQALVMGNVTGVLLLLLWFVIIVRTWRTSWFIPFFLTGLVCSVVRSLYRVRFYTISNRMFR